MDGETVRSALVADKTAARSVERESVPLLSCPDHPTGIGAVDGMVAEGCSHSGSVPFNLSRRPCETAPTQPTQPLGGRSPCAVALANSAQLHCRALPETGGQAPPRSPRPDANRVADRLKGTRSSTVLRPHVTLPQVRVTEKSIYPSNSSEPFTVSQSEETS